MTKNQVIKSLSHATTLTEADINAVLSGLENMLVQFIVLGHSIDLGFLSLGFSIKGGFDSLNDSPRKDRNWVNINATVANSFADAVNQEVKLVRVFAEGQAPKPLTITKVLGDMTTSEYVPNNVVSIGGTKLTFDKADTECGVYLQPEFGSPVRVSEYIKASDSSIFFRLPDGLTPGNSVIEVRRRKTDGKIIKGTLEEPVVIAA
jgi:hypothetical protein